MLGVGEMRLWRVTSAAVLVAACAATLVAAADPAPAARVTVGPLILQADGGFAPRKLPRRHYAPIRFQGHADIRMRDGSVPPAVRRVRLDYDKDGLLTTAGLPVCRAEQLQGTTTRQARSRCRRARVGAGHVGAAANVPFLGRIDVRVPLTFFNGPKEGAVWTVLAHAHTLVPLPETYVVTIPVQRRRGGYSYRSTIDLPPLLGGLGSLTHIDARIERRYRAGGRKRSFVSARCSDGILQTQGFASFANGDVISGSLFKTCTPRG